MSFEYNRGGRSEEARNPTIQVLLKAKQNFDMKGLWRDARKEKTLEISKELREAVVLTCRIRPDKILPISTEFDVCIYST